MSFLNRAVAVAALVGVGAACGCASQAATKPNVTATAPLPAPRTPPPPTGPVLDALDLDDELVVSVGTTFVIENSAASGYGVDTSRVVAVQGKQLTVHHTWQTSPYTAPATGQDIVLQWPKLEPATPIEVVDVAAGEFRCYRTHSVDTVPNQPGAIDATTWTWVDFPIVVKQIATWNGQVNNHQLVRIESAATRPRPQPAAGPAPDAPAPVEK